MTVDGDRITRVNRAPAATATGATDTDTVGIDGTGLTLTPGFIDVHSHDDFAVVVDPEMPFKVRQGVTTDVVGNCGFGAAPFGYSLPFALSIHPDAVIEPWDGFSGYMDRLDAEPPSLNVAVLAGHGTIRLGAGASPDEMAGLFDEALGAGVVGLSTGLIYEPGRRAATSEIADLASVMSGTTGLYATHMRNESERLLEAIEEALEIGRAAGVRVQISHHKASGKANWGLVAESPALLERARASGADVAADQYPYTAGSTSLFAVIQNAEDGASGIGEVDWSGVVVASATDAPEWEGKPLGDLETAHEVHRREPRATVVIHSLCEDDVRTVMRHETTMIGSGGIPTAGKPHPRLWGTFPRVLGHYARDERVLPLTDAVRKMTGFPAATFGLTDRGVIREGAFADLVLLDARQIADRATYDDPCLAPAGITGVWVNGERVVASDGSHTGARPGRALRRKD